MDWIGIICNSSDSSVLAPTGSIPFVIVYVFVVAVAGSLVMPRKDALIQLNINAEERARINALIMSFTIAFSSPFGYFAGWLSSIDRASAIYVFLCFVPCGNYYCRPNPRS